MELEYFVRTQTSTQHPFMYYSRGTILQIAYLKRWQKLIFFLIQIQTSSFPIKASDEIKVLVDQTAQLRKYTEGLRDDIREIQDSLNELKQNTNGEYKHTKDQLQNEVKLREDAMNEVSNKRICTPY